MLIHNNWFQTNLPNRIENKDLTFKFKINPYKFKNFDFNQAADYTANLIYSRYPNLYLAFSGGIDSEFVLRCFYRNKIPIIPIIIKCGNDIEIQHAFRIVEELKITPIVLEISEDFLFNFWLKNILKKFNGIGYNSTHNMIAALYVSQFSDAVIISGNHFMADEEIISENNFFIACDWDFYTDYFLSKSNNINFYSYTIELVYASVPDQLHFGKSWIEYKTEIFQVEKRLKSRHAYKPEMREKINNVLALCKRPITHDRLTNNQFYQLFDRFKID